MSVWDIVATRLAQNRLLLFKLLIRERRDNKLHCNYKMNLLYAARILLTKKTLFNLSLTALV